MRCLFGPFVIFAISFLCSEIRCISGARCGQNAAPNEFKFVGALFKQQYFHCGAILHGSCTVLTAAHCVSDNPDARLYKVFFGINGLSETQRPEAIAYQVVQIVFAPGYDRASSVFNNDLAILVLQYAAIGPNITGSMLAHASLHASVGTECFVVSWGYTLYGVEKPAEWLQKAPVPIADSAVCNNSANYNGTISATKICAGAPGLCPDACRKDSGGPLVCYHGGPLGLGWVVNGVVSYGRGDTCNPTFTYGVYTRVSSFSEWIYLNVSSWQRGCQLLPADRKPWWHGKEGRFAVSKATVGAEQRYQICLVLILLGYVLMANDVNA